MRFSLLLGTTFLGGCAALVAPPAEKAPAPPAKGGYYKDDGPGANPPADLASIPDAVPRAEPLHRFANRPYRAFGKEYVPLVSAEGFRERGLASWYGRRYHGQSTSSGERYDMYAMTAAHPTLPIPSYARVTRLDTGASVVVRINDRGPFHPGRVIDLSYTAAWKLGILEAGSALVEVESIVPRDGVAAAEPKGVFVQLGAFSARESAESLRARLARELAWLPETIRVIAAGTLWRLYLGPYRSQEEARAVAERIRRELDLAPILVVR